VTEWVEKDKKGEASDIEIRGKKIPKTIVQILNNRGYATPEKIEKFFAPSLADLYQPYLINDMEKTADRIAKAIEAKERVLIHGDYDTDGITGTALLVHNLKRCGLDIVYYIPNRLVEGYGLSLSGVHHAADTGCSLIITVDCGITAVQEVSYAKENRIDVIICDHHEPKEILPEAFAILNPKMPGSRYPFKELAGVGVAFKMLQGLYEKLNMNGEELYRDLDLVALGSVVDIVPLISENRILVKHGLKKIVKSDKIGLQALLEETGLTSGLTAYHLGFIIGPRVNACGRLRHAKEALELFLTPDKKRAREIAQTLSADNRQRQELEHQIYQEARELITRTGQEKNLIIVAGKENWHEGIVGIVASRISDDFYRPTILLDLKKDIAKGSARSVPGFDIIKALNYCDRLLTKHGGHSQAAGLELKIDDITELQKELNEYAKKIEDWVFTKKSRYDIKLGFKEITDEFLYFLTFFEPTGMANPLPVFMDQNFEVVGIPRVVGNDHLKLTLRQEGIVFNAIAFGQAQQILDIEVGKTKIDCLYSISEDSFSRKKKVILKIKEMKKSVV